MTTVNPRASLNCLLTRFSGLIALLRTFAWLMKFLQWIMWSSRKNKEETNTREITRRISHAEIEKSTIGVVKLAQKSVFPREIKGSQSWETSGDRLLILPDTHTTTSLKSRPRFDKTSEVPPENNASFLETMAKGILNRSQGTTFIAGKQNHIGTASGSR